MPAASARRASHAAAADGVSPPHGPSGGCHSWTRSASRGRNAV
ncbi:hypothetical protein BU14_1676s0001 [Porphyra umbilicalis]|uniref:Uncharacterized protein n=1 Tax=Porphyra umbilicalis TaxID=2786 RepID=A0A1X6NL67_PORUM|nr:hypothetical protein BU14_1676s0001 [Porphyra umbilicalis]|eukprot:OSX69270.1 hypothetical protein BU14_1676s0001 [Porphyra umbilicalis]